VKILVVEDEPVSRRQLHGLLQEWGYTVETAVDGLEALKLLELSGHARFVVLDRMSLGMDGLDVCRRIRQNDSEPYVYVILLIGQDRKQDMLDGFAAGADDYITRPFEPEELKARLQTGARIVDLQDQLISAREQLRFHGTRDPLTQILNRTAFFEVFDREVSRARRKKTSLALILGDIDHFKRINDRYGHLAGDAVLCETATRLRISQRASDAVGRYGGEEFVILATDCALAGAMVVAERSREAIVAQPMRLAGGSLNVTMSFGLAATADMDEAGRLLAKAEEALYKAKEQGRNRVVISS
jgi:two-component system cell cycle response regulator